MSDLLVTADRQEPGTTESAVGGKAKGVSPRCTWKRTMVVYKTRMLNKRGCESVGSAVAFEKVRVLEGSGQTVDLERPLPPFEGPESEDGERWA